MNTLSRAGISATLMALAGTVHAKHELKIDIDSALVDADEATAMKSILSDHQFISNLDADYSVFNDSLFVDGNKATVDKQLLLLAGGALDNDGLARDQVDASVNNPAESTATIDLGCYNNCHNNCHGSRSWR